MKPPTFVTRSRCPFVFATLMRSWFQLRFSWALWKHRRPQAKTFFAADKHADVPGPQDRELPRPRLRRRRQYDATRVQNVQPKAVFSYCSGHCLNLILQDSVVSNPCSHALEVIRSVVNYVRDSPKRQAQFETFIQMEDLDFRVMLRPLCTTRWVCRKTALDSFVANYEALLQWFSNICVEGDAKEKAEALARIMQLSKFTTYFNIKLLQKLFHQCHFVHTKLQKPSLSVTEVKIMMTELLSILRAEATEDAAK